VKCPGLSSSLWNGILVAACALGLVAAGTIDPPAAAGPSAAPNKYVGAAKCKNCHKAEAGGNQFAQWEATSHSKAFERLASPEAKEAGAKAGVDDPQKADACVKCHITAFGVAAEELASGFKPEMGVQCESCHGPGETHMKARFAAAAKAKEGEKVVVPAGEIVSSPTQAVCVGCHNKESPTFKGFCFLTYEPKIRHLDPRRPLSDERKAQFEKACSCAMEAGHVCTHGEPGSACDKP
jgi:hypothetical protein